MELRVSGIRPLKHWAAIPDDVIPYHPFDADNGPVWCPTIAKDTVRADIRLAKRAGADPFEDYGRIGRFDIGMLGVANEYTPSSDWILYHGNHVLMVGNNRDRLRDAFDQEFRWQLIRPPALRLIPDDDEIEEILATVVHIKDAVPGDQVLRYHSGPVLDVSLIKSLNKTRTKVEIVGDTLVLTPGDFLPPTKYRLQQYRDGIGKLKAASAGALPNSTSVPVFPEKESECIPGRPELTIKVVRCSRSEHYFYFDFEITNDGEQTVRWLHYQWARDSFVPKERCPFAYQNDQRLVVFSVTTTGCSRTLYPGSIEKVSVCVGKDVGMGKLSVLIPAYYFGGCHGSYFMLAPEVL